MKNKALKQLTLVCRFFLINETFYLLQTLDSQHTSESRHHTSSFVILSEAKQLENLLLPPTVLECENNITTLKCITKVIP